MRKSIKKYSTYLIISLVIISVFVLGGCSKNIQINEDSSSIEKTNIEFTKISSDEAKEVINNEDDIIILDVRTLEEYNSGHIENSILIPVDELEALDSSKLVDKNQKILVYCRSGNRSKSASKILVDLGYTNIFDFGGINRWSGEIVK
ncbi:MAG: rhodanese-like domain-containing protein [Clostridium sp.]